MARRCCIIVAALQQGFHRVAHVRGLGAADPGSGEFERYFARLERLLWHRSFARGLPRVAGRS